MDHDLLLTRIAAYCRRYRISEATFGNRAARTSKLVPRLRAGGTITLKTLRSLDDFMMQPTPEGRQKMQEASA